MHKERKQSESFKVDAERVLYEKSKREGDKTMNCTDCFAYIRGGCSALTVKKCQGDKCPFYKTQEQIDAENRTSLFRLDDICGGDIIEKYGLEGRIYHEI